ncbi:hypothetical protein [Roseateles violae]|uniref:Uncharacterized protein n=1 Tax=Roseateles violae TaxID=3058042 RepID=A0ABT8DP20_9BURK|nr:hypothetical protein [Pelomonas sp. PFR6]MDN3920112.1 hypothetical protein [Pelomonas sp. PFR6]
MNSIFSLLATGLLTLASIASAQSAGGAALLARYESLQPQLARSPFQRPLLLQSQGSDGAPQGDVYAVIAHPMSSVAPALQRPAQWCEVLLLQLNIKRCQPAENSLRLAIGQKSALLSAATQPLVFGFALGSATPDYLAVQLSAAEGPLGTRDYRLGLEAVPLPDGRSFVHMRYAYSNGTAARLATSAYLSTLGRNKVGFSITGHDARGQPIYVGGVQGVAERNAMRYFLAIEVVLDSLSLPPQQRLERRLRDWFAATERHALQLHEMELDEYLAMKRAEPGAR